MNIALLLSYDGSAYHGWQYQKNAVSVCETLSNAISKTVKESVKLIGCGRTDAGVHAKRYVAGFRSFTGIPLEKLPKAINSFLPNDIAVNAAVRVPEDFHPINSCIRKRYAYFIKNSPIRDPFSVSRALHYPRSLDLDLCRRAALEFVGTHDFSCVRSLGTPVKSTVRTLYSFEVYEEGGFVVFEMAANGFLYNMARGLSGTLLYVNEGKITCVRALIESKDRSLAGPVLPPQGLYMTGVYYKDFSYT